MSDYLSLFLFVAFGFAAGWTLGNSLGWDRGFAECSQIHSEVAEVAKRMDGGAK